MQIFLLFTFKNFIARAAVTFFEVNDHTTQFKIYKLSQA